MRARLSCLLATLAVSACNCTGVSVTQALSLSISSTGGATGTVDVQGHAACATASCSYKLPKSSPITLTPQAGQDSEFAAWSGDCASASGPAAIKMDVDKSCGAAFRPVKHTLSIHVASGGGIVTTDVAGVDCSSGSCVANVDHGATVTLTATPGATHRFGGWTGDGDCSAVTTSPLAVHVNANGSCTATFIHRFSVSGTVVGEPSGAVTASCSDPFSACSGAACVTDSGGSVVLAAPTVGGFRFVDWIGDPGCTGTAQSLTLTNITTNVSCTASYKERPTITGGASPLAGGNVTVTAAAAGVPSCTGGVNNACTSDIGASVTVTAAPATGFLFVSWSGGTGCSDTTNPLTFAVPATFTCTATFAIRQVAMTAAAGTGGAAGVTAPCVGATCTFNFGSAVTIAATADGTHNFVSWSSSLGATGTCNGSTVNPLTVASFTASETCTANFALKPFTLITAADAGGTASVAAPLGCAGNSSCTVDAGTTVTITAAPDATHLFTSWTSDLGAAGSCNASTANPLAVIVTADETCTASFTPRTIALPELSHVEFTSTDFIGAALAFDVDGSLLAVHKPVVPGNFVSLSRYDSTTGTWVALSSAVNDRPTPHMLALAVDGTGLPYIAFVQQTAADAGAWELVLKQFNGTSVELAAPAVPLLGVRGQDVNQGSMVIDAGDRPVITFSDPNDSNVQLFRLEQGTLVSLATVATLAFDPHLALESDGTPVVAFIQGSAGSNAGAMRVARVVDGDVQLLGGIIDSVPNATQTIGTPRVVMRGTEPWAFWVKNGLANAARFDGNDWIAQPFGSPVDGSFAIDTALFNGDPILAAGREDGIQVLRFHDGAWEPGFAANAPGDHEDRIQLAVRGTSAAMVSSSIFRNVAYVQRLLFP